MNIKISLSLPPLVPHAKLSNNKKTPKDAIRVDIEDTENAMMPDGTEFLKHTCKKGEKVADIAKLYDMSPYDLSKFLIEEEGSDLLYDGQEIEIPVYLVRKV